VVGENSIGDDDELDEIGVEELLLAHLKEKFGTWREAWIDLIAVAPPHAVLAPPRPVLLWAIESGDLDTDPAGGDDPADQVYFAVREGLIKIGFSGSPRRRLSRACTITRTFTGGTLQEAMLQNLFSESQVWRDDRPEGSSAEWYEPSPLLVKLANAGEALAMEARDAAARQLFREYWQIRYPNGCQIAIGADSSDTRVVEGQIGRPSI
jgi:hypothetical protein